MIQRSANTWEHWLRATPAALRRLARWLGVRLRRGARLIDVIETLARAMQ